MKSILASALTGVCLFALAAPIEASAQAAAPEATPEATQDGAAGTQAAPAQTSDADIIVTARRQEERLQDVPISIAVFSQEQLDNRNITSGRDLAAYTPSLSTNPRFGTNNVTFAIRGFTQEIRTTASVGVYFADVVAPRGGGSQPSGDGVGQGAFFDLQNVQILRGPQGTLFGRNTTGGAVLLVPQMPTFDLEGYIEGSIGNYDMQRVQGVLNIPLSDVARFRIGFDEQSRSGYLNNITGIGPDDFGDMGYYSIRASLVVDLTPELENYTVASYSHSSDNGPIQQVQGCNVGSGLAALLGGLCQAQVARQQGKGEFAVQNILPDPKSTSDQWQVINRTTWVANDALTIRNIAAYGQYSNFLRAELFGTNFVTPALPGPLAIYGNQHVTFANSNPFPNGNTANQWTMSEELQFQGTNGALDWQAGFYYERSGPLGLTGSQSPLFLACSDAATFKCVDSIGALASLGAGFPPGTVQVGSVNYTAGTIDYRNIGLYAQATYKLMENLRFTGGIRYTWDRTTAVNDAVTYRFPAPNTPVGRCTFAGLQGYPTGVITAPSQCRSRTQQDSEAPTWLASLDFNPVDDVLLYVKYARGYRQGGVNPFAPPPYQTYEPEKVDTYEGGAKFTFRGGLNGTFNVAGFYNDFSNQIVTSGAVSSTNAATATQIIINAGASRIWGVEVETSLNLFEGFNLSGSYTYLNTELLEITQPTATPGSPYDMFPPTGVVGDPLPYSPENKFSVTAGYTLPLSDSIGRITFSGTYTYSDPFLVQSGPRGTLAGYELLNLNVNWNGVAGLPVDASFFMTNVTDEFYRTNVADQFNQGFMAYTLGEPQMYGFRLRYNFGPR